MSALPSGTVTFLFTDIEGSTARWEAAPETTRKLLTTHNEVVSSMVRDYGGHVFKTVGDAYCVAFDSPAHAVDASIRTHAKLAEICPGVLIRIGIHTASIEPSGNDYFGQPVNRVARITAAAQGGQTLLSDATRVLLPSGTPLVDLGEHWLKDLMEAVRIWQIGDHTFSPPKTLGASRSRLPTQTTSFIGRETELGELQLMMDKFRLVTLTGTGGTGKSRLSLQLVAENMERFPDGVWLVELAPLPDRENVLREVINCVGAPESKTNPLLALSRHLAQRKVCLILDNCEHVLSTACEITDHLVRACDSIAVIATSREPLGASGEAVYRVPSMVAPPTEKAQGLRNLEGYSACALFLDRLATAAPTYGITDAEAPTIARICTRLDGIPLALELAAARGRAMRLDQIEKRLDDRFRLLTGGNRNALSRQQTLLALIDWSVNLLTEQERRLFTSLSVFSGGWQLESAEKVCAFATIGIEGWEVLDLLTALVDKSLVIFEHASGRYKMLESLRQYSAEALARTDWALEVRDRHADTYLEDVDPGVVHALVLSEAALETFIREYENLRGAFDWSVGEPKRAAKAAVLAAKLWPGFLNLGRPRELVKLLEPLLGAGIGALEPDEVDDCRQSLGVAMARSDDPRALEFLRTPEDSLLRMSPARRAKAKTTLSYALFRSEKHAEGIQLLTPLIEDQSLEADPLRAYSFVIRGICLASLGEYVMAAADFDRGCEVHIQRQDWRGWAACRCNSAMTAALRGDTLNAVRYAIHHLRESTARKVHLSIRPTSLAVLGLAALEAGDPRIAAVYFGASFDPEKDQLDPPDPFDRLFRDTAIARFQLSPLQAQHPILFDIGRLHDWEPWYQAITEIEVDDAWKENRFVVPFPELLPQV